MAGSNLAAAAIDKPANNAHMPGNRPIMVGCGEIAHVIKVATVNGGRVQTTSCFAQAMVIREFRLKERHHTSANIPVPQSVETTNQNPTNLLGCSMETPKNPCAQAAAR